MLPSMNKPIFVFNTNFEYERNFKLMERFYKGVKSVAKIYKLEFVHFNDNDHEYSSCLNLPLSFD